jgi:hypothetical protein
MEGMPDPGSPMEILFMVLWRMRQQTEFHKSRAVIQALMSQEGVEGEAVEKAFEDLRNAFFPFEESMKAEQDKKFRKILFKELARGPLRVTPMTDVTKESLKQKLNQGQRELREQARQLRSGQLRPLDRDPFEKARHRRRGVSSTSLARASGDARRMTRGGSSLSRV